MRKKAMKKISSSAGKLEDQSLEIGGLPMASVKVAADSLDRRERV